MHATLSLFCAGLPTFAVLYCVQPVLPVFSQSFHLTPAQGSLLLSITTVMMAPGPLGGVFSHGYGWAGVSAFIAVMPLGGLWLANKLRQIPVLMKKVR